ncbi:MAG TPA: hypothetical protein PK771_05540 [Spirochaetota bacterium]|nr:hypothetical protein [Spirochaetota bacterium]
MWGCSNPAIVPQQNLSVKDDVTSNLLSGVDVTENSKIVLSNRTLVLRG